MEKCIQQYIDDIHNLIPSLIESYVNYYGEEYRDRISEILNSITFIVKNEKFEFIATNNEIMKEQLMAKDNFKDIYESIKTSEACLIPKQQPPIIIIDYMNPIKIHTLIHEINHALHCKKTTENRIPELYSSIFSMFQNREIYKEGIPVYNNDHIVYELLNEYMTLDIINHYKANNPNMLNLDYKINVTKYLYIDYYLDYIFKDFYEYYKTIIKDRLINANGDLLKKDFNEDNYDALENNTITLKDEIISKINYEAAISKEIIPIEDLMDNLKPKIINNPKYNQLMTKVGESINIIKSTKKVEFN